MTELTEEVSSEREARRNGERFDDEYMDATRQKNTNRQKMLQRDIKHSQELFSQSRKDAAKIFRNKKRLWLKKKGLERWKN
jgi:hypothetical protein